MKWAQTAERAKCSPFVDSALCYEAIEQWLLPLSFDQAFVTVSVTTCHKGGKTLIYNYKH